MRRDEIQVMVDADTESSQYYFTYCEAGFVSKTLGDVIITVGREGALELMEGIPL
jgi:cyclopropane-fatty-acyl-phospholipid synthase